MRNILKKRPLWISVLGDSISTLKGYSRPPEAVFYEGAYCYEAGIFTPEDTWWGRLIASLGGCLLVNHSISGSMVCKHRLCEAPTYGCSEERTAALGRDGLSPDMILIFLGINDWGYGVTPTPRHHGEAEDPAVFSVAYRLMLEKLRRQYPDATLCCFTLPISTCTAHKTMSFPYCYAGWHIDAYCEAIRDRAAAYGCRLVDWRRSGIPHDTIDGFHPNADGMRVLAETAASFLSQND